MGNPRIARVLTWPAIVALVLAFGCSGSSDSEGKPADEADAGGSDVGMVHTDAESDSGSDSGTTDMSFDPRCDELVSDYMAQVEQFRSCGDVGDCQVIEGTESCDASPAFGASSGDAVNTDFEYPANWEARVEECADFIEMLPKVADSAPAENLRCEQQLCVADEASCL